MGSYNGKKIKQDYICFFRFLLKQTQHFLTVTSQVKQFHWLIHLRYKIQCSNSTNTLPNFNICDFKECTTNTTESAIRLSCVHTIHLFCYNMANNERPICTKPLIDEIKKTITIFQSKFTWTNEAITFTFNYNRCKSRPWWWRGGNHQLEQWWGIHVLSIKGLAKEN